MARDDEQDKSGKRRWGRGGKPEEGPSDEDLGWLADLRGAAGEAARRWTTTPATRRTWYRSRPAAPRAGASRRSAGHAVLADLAARPGPRPPRPRSPRRRSAEAPIPGAPEPRAGTLRGGEPRSADDVRGGDRAPADIRRRRRPRRRPAAARTTPATAGPPDPRPRRPPAGAAGLRPPRRLRRPDRPGGPGPSARAASRLRRRRPERTGAFPTPDRADRPGRTGAVPRPGAHRLGRSARRPPADRTGLSGAPGAPGARRRGPADPPGAAGPGGPGLGGPGPGPGAGPGPATRGSGPGGPGPGGPARSRRDRWWPGPARRSADRAARAPPTPLVTTGMIKRAEIRQHLRIAQQLKVGTLILVAFLMLAAYPVYLFTREVAPGPGHRRAGLARPAGLGGHAAHRRGQRQPLVHQRMPVPPADLGVRAAAGRDPGAVRDRAARRRLAAPDRGRMRPGATRASATCWKRDEYVMDMWVRAPICDIPPPRPAIAPAPGATAERRHRNRRRATCPGALVTMRVFNSIAYQNG